MLLLEIDNMMQLFSIETVTRVSKSGVDFISPFIAIKMELNCFVNKLVESSLRISGLWLISK